MNADTAKLTELPLFALLGVAERSTLAELFTTVAVRRGERVFRQGDPGASLYIVRAGRIQIALEDGNGQRIVLSENGPGSVFGEISLLDGGPRTAEAVASADADLLMLDRDDLLEFVTKHPPAALSLLAVMGSRLRATNELLREQSSRNLNDVDRARQTAAGRASELLMRGLGSWGAVLAAVAIGAGGVAVAASPALSPGFDLWVAAVLALVAVEFAFLFMTRTQQAEKDRTKADVAYHFNVKTELELARLNRKLDELSEQTRARLAGIELDKAIATPSRPGAG